MPRGRAAGSQRKKPSAASTGSKARGRGRGQGRRKNKGESRRHDQDTVANSGIVGKGRKRKRVSAGDVEVVRRSGRQRKEVVRGSTFADEAVLDELLTDLDAGKIAGSREESGAGKSEFDLNSVDSDERSSRHLGKRKRGRGGGGRVRLE